MLGTPPALARLPVEVRTVLAAALQEERFPAGAVVIHEGEVGDRLYIMVEGQAEASIGTPGGPTAVQTYEPGEMFGELALLDGSRRRSATVTALTPVLALSLSFEALEGLMEGHPEAREALLSARHEMLLIRFLKMTSPFGRLDLDRLRWLSARMTQVALEPGASIVRQGEVGDVCFVLQSGRAEVVLADAGGTERQIAKLGEGAIIGEAALLTDTPRSATVRALEPCTLLRLGREDLIATLGEDRRLALQILELVQLRDRPRRVASVIVQRRKTPEGDDIITLKDVSRSRYYRLSAIGLFVWERLDGDHTLRDLTVEYLTTFKSFSPHAIAEIIAGLAQAGFVETRRVHAEVVAQAMRLSPFQRVLLVARAALDWRFAVRGIDGALGRAYRGAVWPLYTVPGQVVLGIIALSGLIAFSRGIGDADTAAPGGWGLLILFVLYCLSMVAHELGHAFTVKAFGREVLGAGVGWYWFGPVAFVDTSDMWLAGRWPRIAVTLGGLYASVLVAGVSSLVATALGQPTGNILWQLALLSYLIVLFNLDPLLEYDGYYILMDWLDRPGLRRHCLAWLGTLRPAALRRPGELRRHRLELLYGLSALLYVAAMGYVILTIYRPQITGWLHPLLSGQAAGAGGWVVSLSLVVLALLAAVGELRPAPRA